MIQAVGKDWKTLANSFFYKQHLIGADIVSVGNDSHICLIFMNTTKFVEHKP